MTARENIVKAMENIRTNAGAPALNMQNPYYSYDQGRYETYQTVLAWLDAEER
jgi:hypothetical protein